MFSKIKCKDLFKHKTKRRIILKFFLVLFVFLIYFLFITKKYGVGESFLVTSLSWSFFVLCTPIADAGFLIDLPMRLITRVRMIISELFVWLIAITLNLYAYFLNPTIYLKTNLLSFFKHILDEPFPFWSIILISILGTFVSIKFGDELLDKVNHKERNFHKKHKHKFRLIVMIFIFALTFILYDFLLKNFILF